jgi:hypothetical protein
MWLLQEIEGEKRKKVFSNKEKNSILNYWHSSSTQQESFEVSCQDIAKLTRIILGQCMN